MSNPELTAVRDAHRFDEGALERYLTEHIDGFQGPMKIEQFEGRLREIDEALGEPDIWKDHQACERLQCERVKIREDLEPIEFEWSRRAEDD